MALTYKNRRVGGRRRKSARRGGKLNITKKHLLAAIVLLSGGALGGHYIGHGRGIRKAATWSADKTIQKWAKDNLHAEETERRAMIEEIVRDINAGK